MKTVDDPRRAELLARLPLAPGLCATCASLDLLAAPRSVFVRCGLAAHDPRFRRYPSLPVTVCSGYVRSDSGDKSSR